MRNWIVVALYVVFALFPVVVQSDPYWLSMMAKLFINLMLALSMWPLFMVGRLNLAQAAFYGLGAYGVSILMLNLGMSFWLALPIVLVVIAVAAGLIAFPSLRMTGVYFALATFALSEIVRLVYLRFDKLFGGAAGLFNIPSASPIAIPGLPEVSFKGFLEQYYLTFVILVICTIVFFRYVHSNVGLTARAVRGSASLARAIGVNTFRQEMACFILSCVGSALAGALYASYAHYLEPNLFGVAKSIDIQAYVIVGGASYVLGPIIGTILLTFLPQTLHMAKDAAPLITGSLLLITMFFVPTGLIDLPRYVGKWARQARRLPLRATSNGATRDPAVSDRTV